MSDPNIEVKLQLTTAGRHTQEKEGQTQEATGCVCRGPHRECPGRGPVSWVSGTVRPLLSQFAGPAAGCLPSLGSHGFSCTRFSSVFLNSCLLSCFQDLLTRAASLPILFSLPFGLGFSFFKAEC